MRVALFYMPFGVVEYPHLGTGLLKACLEREGHVCDIRNEALEFARVLGRDVYSYIEGNASPMLLGERVFAKQLNPSVPGLDRYYREVVRPAVRGVDNPLVFSREAYLRWAGLMREAEDKGGRWLEVLAADRGLSEYDVFGFSTSYEQNVASLALAKMLRTNHPKTPILFGGSNCMGELGLGLLRAFPFIDFVFTGESELTLVQVLRSWEDPEVHPFPRRGVISRATLATDEYDLQPEIVEHLDSLPEPDYDDYFDALRREDGWRKRFFGIAVEGSRGCWKAKGAHCLFCGLNGAQNCYRSKSPGRFVRELEGLCERHDARYVLVNDNILSPALLSGAFPQLRERRPYRAIWQQIRVGISQSDLELLRDAGARYLGAGLESLSTRLLGIMRKGLPSRDVTALDNIHLLRMATELGIDLTWQILCGLPGEAAEDYQRMASLMRQLHHLVPPKQMVRISIERHSPLFAEAAALGIDLEPSKAYRFVYDLPAETIAGFAYCYQDAAAWGDRMPSMGPPEHALAVLDEIRSWQRRWDNSTLGFAVDDGAIIVRDGRDQPLRESRYSGVARGVIEATMTPVDRREILEHVQRENPAGRAAEIECAIAALTQEGYVLEEGGRYLFLGVDYETRAKRLSGDTDNFFLRAVREKRPYEYDL